MKLQAPFPYYGGKSRIAELVWQRFGDVTHYVEPFFGSGAILLNRPMSHAHQTETVNDLDGMIANFWRAIQGSPGGVAYWADWPVSELDLHARHNFLIERKADITEQLRIDPDFYDIKIAGWWVWGISQWIGGEFTKSNSKQLPTLNAKRGIHQASLQLPHLSRGGMGVRQGSLKRPILKHGGMGVHRTSTIPLNDWFEKLQQRLRHVRIACGDWSRICTPAVVFLSNSPTGIFLDPPYGLVGLYSHESMEVIDAVCKWCMEQTDNKQARIAVCGFEGQYEALEVLGWTHYTWSRSGVGKDGNRTETVWFSPHCLQDTQIELFA